VTALKFDTDKPDYAAGYRDADDLLAFVKSIAPSAEAGDPDALYWTFRASRRCVRDYIIYFGHGDHERTLERALAMNMQYGTFDTVVDMLRRRRPDNFDELQLRASDLNAKLNANRFDEIDL
jgi:hypothetical protein